MSTAIRPSYSLLVLEWPDRRRSISSVDTGGERRLNLRASESVEILSLSDVTLGLFYSKLVEEFADGESRIIALLDERPRFQQRSLNGYLVADALHASKILMSMRRTGGNTQIAIAVPPESLSDAAWDLLNRIAQDVVWALKSCRALLPRGPTKRLVRITRGDARRDSPDFWALRWVN